ncbi:NACHT domain-containing protein [Coleofasciculus chthonoplastes]|uniref:NACHT domain-containing protein n=1 Tax=Coleofasciculus chthonoplastes TaxID=64178 RepID=UPI0032F906CE
MVSDTQQLPLSIQPVISYPREAQVGKTYLMTIDLQPSGDNEWLYEDEEYPIYCMVETSSLFSSKPVGEPAVVLHRFGGSYGAAQFLLTATQEEMEGEIKVTLVNGWGVPMRVLNLSNIKIIQKNNSFAKPLTFNIKVHSDRTNQEDLVISPDFNLTKYQECLRERYSNLNLSSLDPTGCAYKLKLGQVFIPQNVRQVHQILPQVYELPKEHQRRLRESNQLDTDISIEELTQYKEVYSQQPICPINEILNDKDNYRYLVFLGDPGSGKSTLLQYLALDWANSAPNNASLQPIPLLIELRTYMRNRDVGQCKNLLEFFHDSSGIVCHLNQHQLVEQLKAGNALVMFDGLDEVFDPGKREDVITDIHRFTNEYPDVQVIVTSRVIGYKPQRLRDAQFHHFMLQDLEETQVKEFINRWHDLTFTDQADKQRKRERLQRAIDTSKAIKELAGNPLLLTMMAILNRNQELPRDRPELYNQASRVLLHQWDVERALVEHQQLEIQTIDYKDKQAMLRRVAYQIQTTEKGLAGNLIAADELEGILTEYLTTLDINNSRAVARVIIKQLRERNFILCFMGADYYAFMHRTFLAYFCAWEFVWQFEKERTLSLEELKTEVFGKHWRDQYWHEVLRLIIAMIEPNSIGELIDYLINKNLENDEYSQFAAGLFFIAECISEVRNCHLIKPTSARLIEQIKRLTNNLEMCRPAVKAISTTWRDDSDTLLWLKNCTHSEDNPTLRQAAVEELAKAWKNDPDILSILKQRAQSDDDSDVRIAALQGLAQGWKDDFDILLIFHTIVESDEDLDVRQAALRELAHRLKDDPDTLLLLKECIQSDEDPDLRQTALQELIPGWEYWEYNAVIDFISDIKTSIESAIDSDLSDKIEGEKVESPKIPDDNNEASVGDIGEAKEIILNVEKLKVSSNYQFIIPFKLKVECLLTYFIFKADYYTLDDAQIEGISIGDWNDHYYEAEEYYLLEVEGFVSVNILEDEDIAIDSLTRIDVVE